MPKRQAVPLFAADRGDRASLLWLAFVMILIILGSNRADPDFFRAAPPVVALAWLVVALHRNRTAYDPNLKVLVWSRGIWPFIRRREFRGDDLIELVLSGHTKDLAKRVELRGITDPDGEIILFDKRPGHGSEQLLRQTEFVTNELGASLFVEESFDEVLEKTKLSRKVRRFISPFLAAIWGAVCLGSAVSVVYLMLVREGYELPRYLNALMLYRIPEKGLAVGTKIELFLMMAVATGAWLAYKRLTEVAFPALLQQDTLEDENEDGRAAITVAKTANLR